MATTTKRNLIRETAQATYDACEQEIRTLATELLAGLDESRAKMLRDPKDWGYAGSLGHVAEKMQDIVTFLRGEGR